MDIGIPCHVPRDGKGIAILYENCRPVPSTSLTYDRPVQERLLWMAEELTGLRY
jgi:hypothetical protein